ncbi:HPP family protein [Paracandidimonas soli]|uniref:CBS domain-containing membrane protein n=1 Tax=Paracandidimonas soli TaxID=1917182 RepID=A0A4R3VAU4_9BURK|nr:HPP family protein [Paracandidimonas soli]TCV00714.1 CBS domain-containing membrane protein [Paracandidimonas soli]
MPTKLRHWIQPFLPQNLNIDAREMWRALLGAVLAIGITSSLSYLINGYVVKHHWLVSSLGASALLVFLLPTSPLAQPWPVAVGNMVGAFIGVSCAVLVPQPVVAVTIAAALVIPITYWLRCVHPPSVALALFAALQGIDEFRFVLFPVLFDSCILVLVGMVYNTLTGKRYPLRRSAAKSAGPSAPARFASEDLDAALTRYNQALNVSREDLETLLTYVETAAFQRMLGARKSASIMSPAVFSIAPEAPLQDAWALMRANNIKALPVTDTDKRVVGIVTTADFMRHAKMDAPGQWRSGLMEFIKRPRFWKKAEPAAAVRDIMTTPAVTAREDQSVAALIPLFSQGRHRHMPIVDQEDRLAGMVTQSDLLVDLYSVLATGQPAGK